MSTVLDTESVVLEQLDFDTPCEGMVGENDCPHPARWTYLWSCGCSSPYCQRHHEGAQEYSTDSWWCEIHDIAISVISVTPIERKS
ncbi:hypothetical protein SEA_MARCIE_6 [Microbacterium phage Marcie]|nr:hypothetical protein SEA_MARCIE_6 [Microbacterium phage Marcie]